MMKSNTRIRDVFVGVFAADTLPNIESCRQHKKPCAYIANTDTINKPGKHWVALYFPGKDFPEFFDSYGRPPQSEFEFFLGDNYFRNNKLVQHPLTSVCAQYCCFFILKKIQGCSMQQILDYFTADLVNNDIMVNTMIEDHFCVDLDVMDVPYVHTQICGALYPK